MEKSFNPIFEVCAFTIQSCMVAEKAGAARVELCDNAAGGGTTPSYGTIRVARENIAIPLYPIIRPRPGNYYYDDYEMDIIKRDITVCKEIDCNGISVGVQQQTGEIDLPKLQQIIAWAYPMGVTCNRAFDVTPDPFKALEAVIASGCERVLTSGQKSTAPDAMILLKQLVEQAGSRIIVMPGAGIHSGNIEMLINETGATEYHGSARKSVENTLPFKNTAVLDFGDLYITDEEELLKIMGVLKKYN